MDLAGMTRRLDWQISARVRDRHRMSNGRPPFQVCARIKTGRHQCRLWALECPVSLSFNRWSS